MSAGAGREWSLVRAKVEGGKLSVRSAVGEDGGNSVFAILACTALRQGPDNIRKIVKYIFLYHRKWNLRKVYRRGLLLIIRLRSAKRR